MRLLCALGLFLALLHVTTCLLIGAFNIENFGPGKFRKDVTTTQGIIIKATDIITEIVKLYDIILIQEVRDPVGTVTKDLMALVNEGKVKGSPDPFKMISSVYLGPSIRKERYLFIYKDKTVTVVDKFQYSVPGFDRPPFVVKFSSTVTAKEFVLIPIHTSPLSAADAAKKKKKSTVEELDALVDVVAAAKQKWNNNNIMVLGDFNAGSTYVKDNRRNGKNDWDDIRLFDNDNDYHWLIKDTVLTTMVATQQVHDRIVVTTEMKKGVVKAEVFNFKTQYGLTLDGAEKVSDHFPVEVEWS